MCSSLCQRQPVNSELFTEALWRRGGAKTEEAVNGSRLNGNASVKYEKQHKNHVDRVARLLPH